MKLFKKDPMYLYLLILTLLSTGGLQAWRTLFDNFAVQAIGLDGYHIGIIQSTRELPGFLALLVVYVLIFIKEHKLAAMSVLLLGLGICLTGFFPSFYGLMATTLMMSFGFHYFANGQSLSDPAILQPIRFAHRPSACSEAVLRPANIAVSLFFLFIFGIF